MAEGGGGIDWKAFTLDKGIDAILIPVGLFVALWFQGWVDDNKERSDYASLLGDFQTEVAQNIEKVSLLERDLGPVAELAPDKVLGPLQAKFDDFKADTARLGVVFGCMSTYHELAVRAPPGTPGGAAVPPVPAPGEPADPTAQPPVVRPPPRPAPSDDEEVGAETDAETDDEDDLPGEDDDVVFVPPIATSAEAREGLDAEQIKALDECNTFMAAAAKEKPKRFPAVDLSPFYQYVVWQVYLSDGIKRFKDTESKQLGLKLGEAYAAQREVEKRLSEIESLFNDSLMKSSGELAALVAESRELLPDEPTNQDLAAAQPRVSEMMIRTFDLRYQIDNLRNVVGLKVTRLKEYVAIMTGRLADLSRAIDAERKRVGGP